MVFRRKEELYLDLTSQNGIRDFMFIFGPSVKSNQVKVWMQPQCLCCEGLMVGITFLMKCLFWTSFGGNYEDVWYVIKATGVKIMTTGQCKALFVPSSPARHKATRGWKYACLWQLRPLTQGFNCSSSHNTRWEFFSRVISPFKLRVFFFSLSLTLLRF